MRFRSGLSAGLAALLAIFAVAWPARGDDALALAAYDGVWRYADGRGGVERIEDAVDHAVDGLPFFLEPIARDRVLAQSGPHHRVVLRVEGDRVALSADGWGPVASTVGGPSVRVRGPEGERLSLTQRIEHGRLIQSFEHPDGARINTYALSGDGRWLWITARITSPRLPEDAVFRVRYRRTDISRAQQASR
jgi:hypothetical protein